MEDYTYKNNYLGNNNIDKKTMKFKNNNNKNMK